MLCTIKARIIITLALLQLISGDKLRLTPQQQARRIALKTIAYNFHEFFQLTKGFTQKFHEFFQLTVHFTWNFLLFFTWQARCGDITKKILPTHTDFLPLQDPYLQKLNMQMASKLRVPPLQIHVQMTFQSECFHCIINIREISNFSVIFVIFL